MNKIAARINYLLRVYQWKYFNLGQQRDITIDTWNGLLDCDSKEYQVGKTLYAKRSYESEMICNSIGILKKEGYLSDSNKGTVIDIGANIGMICIALLKHHFFEQAIAFEPEPNNFRLLVKNVAQNNLSDKIDCLNYALSSSRHTSNDTEIAGVLELSQFNSGDHRVRYNDERGFYQEENRKTINVKVDTLDNIFSKNSNLNSEEVSLIWMDIQGHEGYFFDGAQNLLSRKIPVISEFWNYGIIRSGMSLSEYKQIVTKNFSHFYDISANTYAKSSIGDIDKLFDIYDTPKKVGSVIFVKD
jgi:FkbM family methyltransferase